MMTQPASALALPHADRGERPALARQPMSNMRFFLTSYAGGLAFFLTVFA